MPHLSKWEVSISTFSNACSQNTDEFIWPSPELWCYSDIWAPRWDPWNSLGPLLNCVAPEHHTNCHDKDLFFTLSCKSIVSNRTCRQIWKSLNKSRNEVKLLCSKHGSNHVSVGLERFILATLFQNASHAIQPVIQATSRSLSFRPTITAALEEATDFRMIAGFPRVELNCWCGFCVPDWIFQFHWYS